MAPRKAQIENPTEAQAEEIARDKALQVAYSKATTKLREMYPAEFNALRTKYAKELGYEWTPRPTAEEKAEGKVRELLAEFPQLADRIKEGEE